MVPLAGYPRGDLVLEPQQLVPGGPVPVRAAGRTASITAPISPSSSASTPSVRSSLAAWAASTYRRAVLRSTPAVQRDGAQSRGRDPGHTEALA
ncbi:hypothetical protein HX746_31335 (plasmid) [Rhodococcus erythropolis]|uniref:hypothetical protein n=1 Tax=Rhodococcus erythropolis TaxID=1833 RepID=UPI001ADAC748|nr:hypothetical protein [Rhodococcus erythropolis]MBO8150770.1 hypothetical protein [Rhodococcus erythropolis]